MNCPYCGAVVRDGSKFCESCGSKLELRQEDDFDYEYRSTGLAPGYSRKLDSPEVLQALKKQKRATAIFGLILIVLPPLGFVIYSTVTGSDSPGSALFHGLVISAVFAVSFLIAALNKKLQKPFEGTLEDKKHVYNMASSERRNGQSRNRYFLYITDEKGKRRRKQTTVTFYNYLNVGDRVRYLPQFPQPFEKYDKSRDPEIPCLFCGKMNPVQNDNCSSCRNPMIK